MWYVPHPWPFSSLTSFPTALTLAQSLQLLRLSLITLPPVGPAGLSPRWWQWLDTHPEGSGLASSLLQIFAQIFQGRPPGPISNWTPLHPSVPSSCLLIYSHSTCPVLYRSVVIILQTSLIYWLSVSHPLKFLTSRGQGCFCSVSCLTPSAWNSD